MFVALSIQHATRMQRIILSVVSPAVPYFSILTLTKGAIFRKSYEAQKCVLIFSTTFVWNISRSKKSWARYHKYT